MNLKQAKDRIYDVIKGFFPTTTVIWAEQTSTRPSVPYLTIKLGDLSRRAFPVERCYHCETTVEINLYTNGEEITTGGNTLISGINTATADVMDLVNYVESEAVTNSLEDCGLELSFLPPVRDLTSLENDRTYRYRAMVEFTVSFPQEARGPYGVGGQSLPDPSGGGTRAMAEEPENYIEEAEINEA